MENDGSSRDKSCTSRESDRIGVAGTSKAGNCEELACILGTCTRIEKSMVEPQETRFHIQSPLGFQLSFDFGH